MRCGESMQRTARHGDSMLFGSLVRLVLSGRDNITAGVKRSS